MTSAPRRIINECYRCDGTGWIRGEPCPACLAQTSPAGTRPTVVDSPEKKEAATTGPNPEPGDEAVGAGSPEIVVNGEIVGYGMEGMARALGKMISKGAS